MTGSSSDDWILLALRLQPLLVTLNHNAITIPHTVAHALGFSVSTSRLLATGLNTDTITSKLIFSVPICIHYSLTAPNCTAIHSKSSNHTQSLHRPTSSYSSSTNFPRLSLTAICLQPSTELTRLPEISTAYCQLN
jgi:hypothetical protein